MKDLNNKIIFFFKISKNAILNKYFFLLLGFFIIGFVIRIYNLHDNFFFGYDQARDFQRLSTINIKNLKLLGPETYIPGLFNSPLYYYFLLPFYVVFHGNPNAVIILLILFNLSTIFILYIFAAYVFNNKKIGLISTLLWAISFEQINFSRHLSNASLMGTFTTIYFLGLGLFFIKKNKYGLLLSIVGLSLAVHMNIYLIYLAILYPILYFIYQPKLTIKTIIMYGAIFSGLLSTFIVAEIKFKFMGIKSLLLYASSQQVASVSIIDNVSNFIQKYTETIYYSFFSINYFWAFLFFIFLVYFSSKMFPKKTFLFLIICSFSTLPLFSYKSSILETAIINSSIFGIITIMIASGTYYFLRRKFTFIIGILFLGAIIFSNFNLYFKDNFNFINRLSFQPMILKEEKQALDYIYQSSNDKQFSVCAITNPLFVNTIWSYLFYWYGKVKYSYLPTWSGQKQYYIESLIPYDNSHFQTRYLIVEPMIGIPDIAKKATIYSEDQISILEDEKKFGEIIIQKRKLEKNKLLLSDTQKLTPEEITSIKITQKIDPRYTCFIDY